MLVLMHLGQHTTVVQSIIAIKTVYALVKSSITRFPLYYCCSCLRHSVYCFTSAQLCLRYAKAVYRQHAKHLDYHTNRIITLDLSHVAFSDVLSLKCLSNSLKYIVVC